MAPVTIEEFVSTVKEMRDWQKRFFKARRGGNRTETDTALAKSKELEKKVDELIDAAEGKADPAQLSLL